MSDSEGDVARLLSEYGRKPPTVSLSAEEKKEIADFVIRNRTFRKVKDAIRMEGWQNSVWLLNTDPEEAGFQAKFAREQGFRNGMFRALELMEEMVTEESETENGD